MLSSVEHEISTPQKTKCYKLKIFFLVLELSGVELIFLINVEMPTIIHLNFKILTCDRLKYIMDYSILIVHYKHDLENQSV